MIKTRCLYVVLTALFVIAPVQADESLQRVLDAGVLDIAVYDAFPPFSTLEENGKPHGIDIEIGRELAKRLGLKANFRFQPADESVEDDLRNAVWKGHYIGGGVADVMLHIPADPRFAAMVDQVVIDGVYYIEDVVLSYREDAFAQAPELDTINAEKIGVEIETIADLYLLSVDNGRLRENVAHFSALATAVTAMTEGEISAVMGHRAEVQGLIGEREGFGFRPITIPGIMISRWPLGVAVKADHHALSERIMAAMKAMVDDGAIDAIFSHFGATRLPGS